MDNVALGREVKTRLRFDRPEHKANEEPVIEFRESRERAKQEHLPTSESFQVLGLDRENLIELSPTGQTKRLVKNLKIRRGGPLSQLFSERLGDIAKDYVELGLMYGNNPPKLSFHFNTNLWMKKKTLLQLHQELDALALKYNTIATTEEAIASPEELTPVVWFFVIHNTEINQRLFDRPKNF